jgi:hypothetical protein
MAVCLTGQIEKKKKKKKINRASVYFGLAVGDLVVVLLWTHIKVIIPRDNVCMIFYIADMTSLKKS